MKTKTDNNSTIIDALFDVGAHFGFPKSRRHPTAKSFIFGAKNNIEIFDLEKTETALAKALEFVSGIAQNKGMILFVGGKSEARAVIERSAKKIEQPFVASRWIGGTLTNFAHIRKRVELMESLIDQKEKGELTKYTKKERLLIDRDIERLGRFFGGLTNLKQMPKAMFVVDPRREHIAVAEAHVAGIPVVALAGSDCNMKEVEYPIPANDATVKSVAFFVEKVVAAYKDGLMKAPAEVSKGTKE